jgi:hypothetical protein
MRGAANGASLSSTSSFLTLRLKVGREVFIVSAARLKLQCAAN